ncbi:MAG: AraC family transcriptional regulator [Bacteroidetes bacterium]|nr:MAG: AraC family transcriptional regulator [Bacteroidota bacterium]PTM12656.1 MAG: AraC family transcriptional regulator [Bacteroidota bacterium]
MQPVVILLTDARRKILWVNKDFTKITGYTYDEAVGKIPGDLLQGPLTEREAIELIRSGLKDMVAVKADLTNYRKDGIPYLCKLIIHPVFSPNNELTNFIAFEVDGTHTSLPEAEQALVQFNDKYRSSSLKGLAEIRLFGRIKTIMEEEKLYLNPNLSLKTLAHKLDSNTKYLSQVVNQCTKQNFQQFINSYRLASVKECLAQGEQAYLTLFGIAQQCGFKNKSTFFKVFKETVGKTPKAYLEKYPEKNPGPP